MAQLEPEEKRSKWYRDMGELFQQIADEAVSPLKKELNEAESQRYFSIAFRLEADGE